MAETGPGMCTSAAAHGALEQYSPSAHRGGCVLGWLCDRWRRKPWFPPRERTRLQRERDGHRPAADWPSQTADHRRAIAARFSPGPRASRLIGRTWGSVVRGVADAVRSAARCSAAACVTECSIGGASISRTRSPPPSSVTRGYPGWRTRGRTSGWNACNLGGTGFRGNKSPERAAQDAAGPWTE